MSNDPSTQPAGQTSAATAAPVEDGGESLGQMILTTLDSVYTYLAAVDQSNAAANLAQPRERKLTALVRQTYELVLASSVGAREEAGTASSGPDAP